MLMKDKLYAAMKSVIRVRRSMIVYASIPGICSIRESIKYL